jgi:hypothetical protein
VITVYVSIGNSDDKLTQREWADFQTSVDAALNVYVSRMHGHWASLPDAAWQNACWCVEVGERDVPPLRRALAKAATDYRQDSIAWAVAETEFIGPAS